MAGGDDAADDREHRVEPEPVFEVRCRVLLLRVRTIRVVSRSSTTSPPTLPSANGVRCETRARACARKVRIAAIASQVARPGSPSTARSAKSLLNSGAITRAELDTRWPRHAHDAVTAIAVSRSLRQRPRGR